jgi:hypothetical protein
VALIPHDNASDSGPCGWWSAASPLARVWAELLDLHCPSGAAGEAAGAEAPGPAPDLPPAATEAPPPPRSRPDASGFVPGALAAPAQPPPPPAPDPHVRPIPADAAAEAGFAFLYRHERKPGDEKR